eukprot:SAG11_NODE_11580_length_751_cov_0.849693_1_plen_79_part_01
MANDLQDGSGSVSKVELAQLVKLALGGMGDTAKVLTPSSTEGRDKKDSKVGRSLTPSELGTAMKELDSDGSGEIEFKEF